jgi:hypothetical protein
MLWTITLHREVVKVVRTLPPPVQDLLRLLLLEIEDQGSIRGDWPNYGKLPRGRHHCHLKKGRPTYVAVCEERGRRQRLVEVIYVGTHEKAPY